MSRNRGRGVHTVTGSVHDHVHVDFHDIAGAGIDAELIIGPAPDVFCEVVQNKKNGDKDDEKSEETARF